MNAAARSVRPNYIGMSAEELRELVDFYQERITEAALAEGFVPIVPEEYASPYAPVGYDTVLSYLSKNDPVTLGFMDDEPEATMADDEWLRIECLRVNMRRVEVPGSRWHARQGLFSAWSYPVALLAKRFGI